MALTRPTAAQIVSSTVDFTDPLIRINKGQSGVNDKDIGVVFERGSDTNVALFWDESADQFVLVNTTETGSTSGNVSISSYADLQIGAISSTSAAIDNITIDANTISSTNTNGNINITPNGTGQIVFNGAYSFPASDGTNGQILVSDGAGNLSFTDISTTLSIAGDSGTDTVSLLNDTLTFSGTANEITTAITNNTVTIGLPDDVTIGDTLTVTGNLIVNGTTTTISTTNTTISDNLLELNSGAASNANDSGIIIERGSTGDNAIFAWDESADKFIVGTTTATADSTGNLTISNANLVADIFEGNGVDVLGQGTVKFYDSDSSNYVALRSSGTVASNVIWTLPAADGTSDQVLSTNGSGTLSFVDVATTLDEVTANGNTTTNSISVGNITVSGNIVPSADETYSLGTSSLKFLTLHVASSTVFLGENSLSIVNDELYLNGNPVAGAGDFWPGSDGNYDSSKALDQSTSETPFEEGGVDNFGVSLSLVFDNMSPEGAIVTYDYSTGEAYVGA